MQLRELLRILADRWKLILLSVLLCVGAAAAVTALTQPVYTATARIYLSAQDDPSKQSTATFIITSDDLETYVSVLDTPAVLDPLREELGMPAGHPVDVSAVTNGNTSILDVTARAADPQEAAEVANQVGPQLAEVAGEFSVLAGSGQRVVSTPIEPATAPGSPSTPDPVRNVGLALLTGLVLGVGLALLRNAMDTKVRGEEDVQGLSEAPMLAQLPVGRRTKRGLTSLLDEPHGPHAEAVRRLRTNLMFVDVTTGGHAFVVTSAMPGEGKTTTAVNLALSMADSGIRTLLVDGDLRNPSVHRLLGLEGGAGLTTLLLGHALVDDVVQPVGDTGLDVLAAGDIPPNPSELLGSEPMRRLFVKLTEHYDFIVLDSPPVLPVIDAVVLERLVGGLLLVVAANRTRKRDLAHALRQLTTVGASVSGFGLNLVADGKRGYGYGAYPRQARGPRSARGSSDRRAKGSRRRDRASA